jgi:hypothetical protein
MAITKSSKLCLEQLGLIAVHRGPGSQVVPADLTAIAAEAAAAQLLATAARVVTLRPPSRGKGK